MALAFDPNQTFFSGIKQVQTNTYQFIEKEWGKGLREGSRKKLENYSQSKFLFQKQLVVMNQYLHNSWMYDKI